MLNFMDKSAILLDFEKEANLRNISPRTIKSYIFIIKDFLKNAKNVDYFEVKEYLLTTKSSAHLNKLNSKQQK